MTDRETESGAKPAVPSTDTPVHYVAKNMDDELLYIPYINPIIKRQKQVKYNVS